jgi:predicted DNA repair protein MutK
MMRSLSVIGTIAMFMVGGGILTHGLPFAHHAIEAAAVAVEGVAVIGPVLGAIAPAVLNALFGVVAGAVVLVIVKLAQRVLSLFKTKN